MRVTNHYTHSDFDRILEISDRCYAENERPTAVDLRNMILVSDVFLLVLDHETNFKTQSGILGFAIVKNVDAPYLWSIAVDPWYQRCGYGQMMLDAIVKHYTFLGDKEISLHVNVNNGAQALYLHNGFREIEVVKNYYPGADALYMKKDLQEVV